MLPIVAQCYCWLHADTKRHPQIEVWKKPEHVYRRNLPNYVSWEICLDRHDVPHKCCGIKHNQYVMEAGNLKKTLQYRVLLLRTLHPNPPPSRFSFSLPQEPVSIPYPQSVLGPHWTIRTRIPHTHTPAPKVWVFLFFVLVLLQTLGFSLNPLLLLLPSHARLASF